MDDDYVTIYDYVGDKEQEYLVATNVSNEEHEMQKYMWLLRKKISIYISTKAPLV